MKKSLIATCFLLFTISPSVFSQRLGKSLLWKISGNGLGRPSYIYGTMHVADPRLFVLGDSLLQAISNSEGFANELDLNQITPMITELVQDELTHSVSIKKILSKNKFEQYGPALAKKFKKPAADITTMDVLKEKNKWIDERMKGKKMQTFLDAYLTDLANRQGKWIGGIEDFSDQSGLINSMIDESDIQQLVVGDGSSENTALEKMTALYLDGDIEEFESLINGMDSNSRDVLLIKRNHKMAYRMDSLAHSRSIVFAVGAAHLPGAEGLIRLLRARGFSVEPVFSSKKIKPEDYKVKEVVRPWVEVKDPQGRYSVMMPGNPGDIKLYGLLTMQLYYNIFNGTLYMTFSMPTPYSGKVLDSAEQAMAKQMFGGTDYKEEKKLLVNGIPGRAFLQKNAEGYKKVYLLNKDNIIYFALGFSASVSESSLQALGRFFDSYHPVVSHAAVHTEEIIFTDSSNFYKVKFPSDPVLMEHLPQGDQTVNVRLFVLADAAAGRYYFCGATTCKKDYSFLDDSLVIQLTHNAVIQKYTDIRLDTAYTLGNRRIQELDGSMMNGTTSARTKITVRGNRYYTVMILYPPGHWSDTLEQQLNSLKLMDYPAGKWRRQTAPDSLFSTWAPSDIVFSEGKDNADPSTFVHYESYDTNRAQVYTMRMDTLSKYVWWKNDTALWHTINSEYVRGSDSLLAENLFTKNGLPEYEYLSRAKGGNNILRMHMWLRGDTLYRMFCLQEPETIGEENVNRFFEKLQFNRPAKKTHAFDSKAALLLNDLRSGDTLISRAANRALSDAAFEVSDIPMLRQAVLIHYMPDPVLTNSTNGTIAEKIVRLNDSSSVAFAKQHFAEAADEEEKNGLMDIISAWQTKTNYDSLGKLFAAFPPTHIVPKWIIKKWTDSLETAAHLYPALLPFLGDSVLGPAIYDLTDKLLDDSLISLSIFRPWQFAILQYADGRFQKIIRDTSYFKTSDYSVIYLLQRMKSDSCNAMLKKWLGVKGNPYHKRVIVQALLKNHQTVSPAVISELAANEKTRIRLYSNLKENKMTALFPAKYLTQSYFAESLVRGAASDYSDQDEDIQFLQVREMKWHGRLNRFFFYDVHLQDDDKHLLAVAGPYNMDKTNISFYEALSDIYTGEYYDAGQTDRQMKAAVEKMEEK